MALDHKTAPDGLRVLAELTARGDELAQDGRVGLPQLLAWFEHARWQAVMAGSGELAALSSEGRLMVVRHQAIALHGRVRLGERVLVTAGIARVGTTSVGLAQSMWRDGETPRKVAELRLTGVALGPDRRPAPLPEAVRAFVQHLPDPPLLQDLQPQAITAPPWTWQAAVRPSEIDVFHHVNHARYASWVQDALVLGVRQGSLAGLHYAIDALALDYHREITLGETIDVAVQPRADAPLADAEVRVAGEVRCRAVVRLRSAGS
jgi:acyl-CoA thioesterase FadM